MWATVLLVAVVTLQSCGMAYIHDAKLKVLLYALPLPLTASTLVSGLPFEATHVIGIFTIWCILWLSWLLKSFRRLGIMAVLGIVMLLYLATVFAVLSVIPKRGEPWEPYFYYGIAIFQFCLALLLRRLLPERNDPGHHSSLPVYLKFTVILVIVCCVVVAKDYLRGFMVSFPYITLFGLYESRHSLYTFAWRNSYFILAAMPALTTFRLLFPDLTGIGWGLAGLWCVYLPLYFLFNRKLIFVFK
ncbi:MAG: hypothetical protein FWG74_03535 [Planctomycetes bacterium]|nr:hypothetical protein [Planctomycetota bacterium]